MSNPQSVQCLSTSYGKCQPLDSKVLTPSGFIPIGDITKGDKVITPDGCIAEVLDTFNPGNKDVYELTFIDGRTAKSCEDHLWKVYNAEWRRTKTGPWRVLPLSEIINIYKTRRGLKIPLISLTNDVDNAELPIDPWLMGIMLGDGSFRNNRIVISTADTEIVEKINDKLHEDYTIKHVGGVDYQIKFKDRLIQDNVRSSYFINNDVRFTGFGYHFYNNIIKQLNLNEKYSNEKFIPEVYFTGSYHQRMELIRGLMDSDGTTHNGGCSFSTSSERLAQGLVKLIRSVGGIPKIYNKKTSYTYNGAQHNGQPAYEVYIRFPAPHELFSLTRKREKIGTNYYYKDRLRLKITDIKKVSHEPVKCILIDHPDHLYITDNYVVTHNTILTATLCKACEKYGRTLTIVPNKSLVEQTFEDFNNCGLDVGMYYGDKKELNKTHTICTWQSLSILDKRTKDVTDEDIFTLTTFLEDVNIVICDECHQVKGAVLRQLLTQNLKHVPIRWGLTGTIPKEDINQQALFTSLGHVVNTVKASELQEQGILSSCHIYVMQLLDHMEFKKYPDELQYLVTNKDRIEYISQLISGISETGNTLILVSRIDTGKMLQALIPGSVFISGEVTTKARKDEYDTFKTENSKILIATAGVAAVGINIVSLYNLVMIEPGKSFVRVMQSIGRGLRKGFGKDHVDIWDITSTCKFSNRHLTERKRYYKDAQYPFTIQKIDWT